MPEVTTTSNLFSHETVSRLVVDPLFQESVALRTLRRITTSATEYFLPKVGLGSAAFADELETLTDADVQSEMVRVIPRKVGAVQLISNESIDDASASTIIGQAIVSGLADQTDRAFFAGDDPKGPAGLSGLEDVTPILDSPDSLDPFSDAIVAIEAAGGRAGAIYMSPATWGSLAKLKTEAGSNLTVLSPDRNVDSAQPRSLFGVPVHLSRHIDESEAWVLDTQRTVAVVRLPFRLAVHDGPAFDKDGTLVRAVGRVEFASVYEATVAHIAVVSS